MPSHKILSVAQLLVLSTAAQRPDRMILPLPSTLRVRGATQRRLLASLLTAALAEEVPVADDALCWRREEAGQRLALRLTAAGLAAVTAGAAPEVSTPSASAPDPEAARPTAARAKAPAAKTESGTEGQGSAPAVQPPTAPAPARPAGKLGRVLDALSATEGATLAEIVALTGWQAHSARAALTGLRQRGFAVTLDTSDDGRKAYRLAAAG